MACAVVFDLDGTLAYTLQDLVISLSAILAEEGLDPVDLETGRGLIGHGAREFVGGALPPGHPTDVDALVKRFRAHYEQRLCVHTAPYPGVPELLDALVARGVRLAVWTNKPEHAAVELMDGLFGRWPWRIVRGQRDDLPIKPDPSAAAGVLAALGVESAAVVMVGDSDVDVHAAQRAGFLPVGVAWGYQAPQRLRDAGAHVVLERAGDLLTVLDQHMR